MARALANRAGPIATICVPRRAHLGKRRGRRVAGTETSGRNSGRCGKSNKQKGGTHCASWSVKVMSVSSHEHCQPGVPPGQPYLCAISAEVQFIRC